MICSRCGNETFPNAQGCCEHCHEALLDKDRDYLVKIADGTKVLETCCLCAAKDGRVLPDSFRGKPICMVCGNAVDDIMRALRVFGVHIAIRSIKETGLSITEALVAAQR